MEKKFEINKKYILVVKVNDKETFLTGEIIKEDDNFFTIIDKFGEEIEYNKSTILSKRRKR
jgi:hypothetical protein